MALATVRRCALRIRRASRRNVAITVQAFYEELRHPATGGRVSYSGPHDTLPLAGTAGRGRETEPSRPYLNHPQEAWPQVPISPQTPTTRRRFVRNKAQQAWSGARIGWEHSPTASTKSNRAPTVG